MKKMQIRLLALLAVMCLIFCGCAVEDQTVTVEELTLTIPGDDVDCSKESYAAGYSLVYGSEECAVMALEEPYAIFEEYGFTDMTVNDYVQLLQEGYQLNIVTDETSDLVRFTFESDNNTYLAGVYASEDSFWMIQAGCPTENFKKQEKTFNGILDSVSFGNVQGDN